MAFPSGNVTEGLQLNILLPFIGTDLTDSGVSLNSWGAYAGGTRTPDNTSTWYTTNDATFELTGLQLEAGTQATAFEHHNFAEELAFCQRYCMNWWNHGDTTNNHSRFAPGYYNTTSQGALFFNHPVPMRATDGRTLTHNIGYIESFTGGGSSSSFSNVIPTQPQLPPGQGGGSSSTSSN